MKPKNNLREKRIAILIDGDNAQASLIEQIVVESSRYGNATIRRIYGDWTSSSMKSWKDTLNSYAFQPFNNSVIRSVKLDRFSHDHRRDGHSPC